MDTVTAPRPGQLPTFSLEQLATAFASFCHVTGFAAITSEAEYAQAIALTEAILDATRDTPQREDAAHPLMALLDWLTPAIREYETTRIRLPDAAPREILRLLMEQHGLSQSQLPEIGNQSVVSQILSGQRKLNTRQIAALSRRFAVSADAFIDQHALAA